MVFISFTGLPRTGKTLACTIFSLVIAGNESGWILGNYPIVYVKFREITPYHLVGLLKRGRVDVPVVLATQEVYGWLDSYISMSKINRFESYFVFQASKMNYHWVWDSQRAMKVDSSLRDMTPYRFNAERVRSGFRYTMMDRNYPDKNIPTNKRFSIPFEFAEQFYGLYDTYKGAIPIGYDEMLTEMERLMPEIMESTIEFQVRLLRDNAVMFGLDNFKGITRDNVEYALMRLRQPPTFSKYVCTGLRQSFFAKKKGI